MLFSSDEVVILSFHLSVMRKPVKKGLKKNYGLFEGKRKMKVYDAAMNKINAIDSEQEQHVIEFTEDEGAMLQQFLAFYTNELKATSDNPEEVEQDETFIILSQINERLTA